MSAKSLPLLHVLDDYLPSLSMHDIEAVITKANQHLRKYNKHKQYRRGNLSPYITHDKLQELLDHTFSEKFKFIFFLMRKLALRCHETYDLNLTNIDVQHKQIFIPNSAKSHMPDICYLDQETTNQLTNWINKNIRLINKNSGYLFFPDPKSRSKNLHISKNMIRKYFVQSSLKANIQVLYGKSRNTNRSLHLYTPHSLRHSGITDFYIKTKDLILTQKYARHQDIKSTIKYIHHTEEDLRNAIESNFVESDSEFKEFVIMYDKFKNVKKKLEI